jgi:hypothetical protein
VSFLKIHRQKKLAAVNPYANTHKCSLCKKYYVSKSSLTRHHREIHSLTYVKPKTQIECTECGRIFTSTRGWKKHDDTWHATPKIYQCSWCERTYLSKTRGSLHVKENHDGTATLLTKDANYKPLPPKEWFRPFESTSKQIKMNIVHKDTTTCKTKKFHGPTNTKGERLTIELPTERKQHTYRQHPSSSQTQQIHLKKNTTHNNKDIDRMALSIENLLSPIMKDLMNTRPLSPIEDNQMDVTPIPSLTDLFNDTYLQPTQRDWMDGTQLSPASSSSLPDIFSQIQSLPNFVEPMYMRFTPLETAHTSMP